MVGFLRVTAGLRSKRNHKRRQQAKDRKPKHAPRPLNHHDKQCRFREGDRVYLANFPDLHGTVTAMNTRHLLPSTGMPDMRTSVFDYTTGHFRTTILLDQGNFVITYDPLIEFLMEDNNATAS